MKNIINWSEVSRYITKGDRNGIRSNKIPEKHIPNITKLFHNDLPKWWDDLIKDKFDPINQGK